MMVKPKESDPTDKNNRIRRGIPIWSNTHELAKKKVSSMWRCWLAGGMI